MKILNQTRYEYLGRNYRRLKKRGLMFLLVALVGTVSLLAIIPLLGIIVGGIFGVIALKNFDEAENFKRGKEGEKAVVNTLQELDDSWWLINDVKITKKGGNIDHILLSPKGVFVLEAKNYEGSIRCYQDEWSKRRKRRKRFIPRYFPIESVSKQARFEAFSLRRLLRMKAKLDIGVVPICVFTNPEVKLKVIKPRVKVLKIRHLTKFLQKIKPKQPLSEKELGLISQCILEKNRIELKSINRM